MNFIVFFLLGFAVLTIMWLAATVLFILENGKTKEKGEKRE
jgi:hypothetical protein